VLDTVVKWTGDLLQRLYGPEKAKSIDILDVGCGNGTMLVGLAAQGFRNLAGSDYSGASIDLAHKVLERHGLSHIGLRVRCIFAAGKCASCWCGRTALL